MNPSQFLILVSLAVSALCVASVVRIFAEPGLQFESTVTVLLIYFVIGFFGYMRAYAHELAQRREPFVP